MEWWNRPRKDSRQLGPQGGLLALQYLQARGLVHVESNFRRPFGEIDLIMQDHATLVFVEVRSCGKSRFGGTAASIDAAKRHRLVMAVQAYLQRYPVTPPCRVDVIAIDNCAIQWLKNVIEA